MTDLHLRVLRLIAKRRERALDCAEDAGDRAGEHGSPGHMRDLEHAAGQANANLKAAEARRSRAAAGSVS